MLKMKLQLPETIRAPLPDEVPMNSIVKERLELRKSANLIEGYKLVLKDNNPNHANLAFNFFSEININNSRLWDLVIELSAELPNEVSLIFHYSDSEPIYGQYADKEQTIDFLKDFNIEIAEDPFLNIGLIFHSETELIEIFVDESKYIKFWGVDFESFSTIMTSFSLNQIDDIEFVDEYPKVREPLRLFRKNVLDTGDLIKLLIDKFESH